MSEMVRLGDVGMIITGNTPKTSDKENYSSKDIPFIKPSDISETEITPIKFSEYFISEQARNKARILPTNSILVTCIGIIGKIGISKTECAFNQQINAIIPDLSKCIPEYLAYAIYSRKEILQNMANAPVVPILNKSQFSNIEIPLPPLPEQRRIAAVLDKVSELIALRKRQLDLLDEMVKARFVEMFGDPVRNEKGWDQLPLIQACKAIFGGGTPSKSHPEYYNGNTPWVTPKDMKRTLITDSIDHITDDAIKNSTTNLVPQNSVLMVIRSGILKHTLPVAINIIPVTINQDMKAFITDELISPIFLMYYFKSIESDVLSGVRGVTADNIDFKTFQRSLIPIPPIELQNQFADFVQQVEKSKATVQQGIDRLNLLKSALMQEYFG